MASITPEELKQAIRQYGLIKGNDAVNEALIDRVATIVLREFEVQRLIPLQLAGGPIDLSNFTSPSPRQTPSEAPTEVVAAAPSSPRNDTAPVSSEIATVVATPMGGPQRTPRAPKTGEEQAQEVEAAMRQPAPPPEFAESSAKRLRDGQLAPASAQRSHFSNVIRGVVEKQAATLAERAAGGTREPGESNEDSRQSPGGDEVEVEEQGGVESIVDIRDTDLRGLFPAENLNVSNPKDAAALRNVLPKRLDADQDPAQRGKQRSIRRTE